jgi:hypothetical protein
MRRAALPLVIALAAFHASASLAATPTSAMYSLRIETVSPGDQPTIISGTGQIDDTKRLASFEFKYGGLALSAIIVSSPEFVAYVRRANARTAPWQLQMVDEVGSLMDPGLALRLGSLPRRALGAEQMDGVRTMKYAITIPAPAASLLAPALMQTGAGHPVTAWIDASGAVHRMYAELGTPAQRVVIDERLGGFDTPVQLTRPRTGSPFEPPVRPTLAESVLDVALVDVESWFYDHGRTYTGMTTRALRTFEAMFPDATIVRATATTYCIQATVSGITKHQNGPKAPYASGPC